MQQNQEVIKLFVFTLMALILVLTSIISVRAVCIGDPPCHSPPFFDPIMPPFVWMCNQNIITNYISIDRINNSVYEGEEIQWRVLVFNKNGINKIQNIFGVIGRTNGIGNNIQVNCISNNISNSAGIIDPSCNAKILDEQITTFFPSAMSYYFCSLKVEDSKSMNGEYWLTAEAVDMNGISGTPLENRYLFLNPISIYPNPEITLSLDIKNNELILTSDENSSIKNYTEKCLNKQCIRKIEKYLITNVYNQNLSLELRDTKSKNQNTIEILSLTYNDNKISLKSNKFIIKNLNNEINEEFTYNKTKINIIYNKKKNESRINIQDKNKRVNKKENGLSLINLNIINGNLNYEIIKSNQTIILNNQRSNPKIIDCDWRPYTDENGCYAIFGNKLVNFIIGGKNHSSCLQGNLLLGYNFNGNSCVSNSGFGLHMNKKLFQNLRECEEECLY